MKKKTCRIPTSKLQDSWQELHDELTKEYWDAENADTKDSIQLLSGYVNEILTEINRADFSSKTPLLKGDSSKLKNSIVKIENTRREIDKTIKTVKTAAKVADALDKALDASAKLLI